MREQISLYQTPLTFPLFPVFVHSSLVVFGCVQINFVLFILFALLLDGQKHLSDVSMKHSGDQPQVQQTG